MTFSSFKHSFFGAAVAAVLTASLAVSPALAQKGGKGGGGGGGGGGGRGNAGARAGGGGGGGGPRVNVGGNAGGGAQINRAPQGNPGGGNPGGGPRVRVEGGANVQGGGNLQVNPGQGAGRAPRADRPQMQAPASQTPAAAGNVEGAVQGNVQTNVDARIDGSRDGRRSNTLDPRNNIPRDMRDGQRDIRNPGNLTDAQREAIRDGRNFDGRRDGDFDGRRDGNFDGRRDGNPIPRYSFYRGAWSGNNLNNATRARAAAALGIPYGNGFNSFGSGYGYNNFGFGGGGNNTTGNLLRLGLALAGYGGNYGGYGLGGLGGLGGYGLGGYGLGNYGGYGLYGGYPIGWGLGGLGLGSLAYSSGYLPYSNPYYNTGWGGYNYGRPLMIATSMQANPSAADLFNNAIAQFQAGDYNSALTTVDNAIAQNPNDPAMHEFRALTLFAQANYPAAAATIHSVLAVGPGWNWDTMAGFYPDVAVYETQLRALEQAANSGNTPEQHFLLGYHYQSTGHPDAASAQFAKVVELNPNDRVAADLRQMNQAGSTAQVEQPNAAQTAQNGAPALPPDAPNAQPQQPAVEAKSVDPAQLVGTWHAQRDDGSKFELTLTPDKQFTWTVHQQGGQEQQLTGTYEVEKDLLALQSPQAGAMVAQVDPQSDAQFNFKLLGAPQNDQGLAFNK